MKKILLFVTLAFTLSSCATIFTGSKKSVVFNSNVEQPVTLTIDGYKIGSVNFPFTMRVDGGFSDTYVKAETEGYEPVMLIINKIFNPIAIINLCDPLGWAIDAATGAMMKPEFKFYEIEFVTRSKSSSKAKIAE